MAPHSSTLAWRIPWTEEPGGLQSMGSMKVRHDWATSLLLFTFTHWRRKWQPTPVFLPGESQGRGSLVGCHLWGRTEWDMTEVTQQQLYNIVLSSHCAAKWVSHTCTSTAMCVLSRVKLFTTLWTVHLQAPLSMGFSRQEYRSGLPFPSSGDRPDPGTEPTSLTSPALAGGFFTNWVTREALLEF